MSSGCGAEALSLPLFQGLSPDSAKRLRFVPGVVYIDGMCDHFSSHAPAAWGGPPEKAGTVLTPRPCWGHLYGARVHVFNNRWHTTVVLSQAFIGVGQGYLPGLLHRVRAPSETGESQRGWDANLPCPFLQSLQRTHCHSKCSFKEVCSLWFLQKPLPCKAQPQGISRAVLAPPCLLGPFS